MIISSVGIVYNKLYILKLILHHHIITAAKYLRLTLQSSSSSSPSSSQFPVKLSVSVSVAAAQSLSAATQFAAISALPLLLLPLPLRAAGRTTIFSELEVYGGKSVCCSSAKVRSCYCYCGGSQFCCSCA